MIMIRNQDYNFQIKFPLVKISLILKCQIKKDFFAELITTNLRIQSLHYTYLKLHLLLRQKILTLSVIMMLSTLHRTSFEFKKKLTWIIQQPTRNPQHNIPQFILFFILIVVIFHFFYSMMNFTKAIRQFIEAHI